MFSNDVNLMSVFIAALSAMVLGFIWYGPLFGKDWMALMKLKASDIKKAKDKMPMVYAQALGLAFLQAFTLDTFITLAQYNTLAAKIPVKIALVTAFLLWLGFIAVPKYHDVIFEGKRKKLFAINAGYQLANMLIMAIIVGAW